MYPVVTEVNSQECQIPGPCRIPGQVHQVEMFMNVNVGRILCTSEYKSTEVIDSWWVICAGIINVKPTEYVENVSLQLHYAFVHRSISDAVIRSDCEWEDV